MIRWSPNNELASLHSAMDRLFDDFFGPVAGGDSRRPSSPTYSLPIDVKELEGAYEIRAAVPGFAPDDVDVTFADGVLRIDAKRQAESGEQGGGYLRRELAWGNYHRALQLPADVDGDGISAGFADGMLTINVPKLPRP